MFDPFSQDELRGATGSLLLWAGRLRDAWAAFREGRHDGDFRKAEREFARASADLHEMHMVLAPPKHLTGAELAGELVRLRDLEAFPDQELIRPAMNAAAGRIAKIARHVETPKGRAKMDGHRAQEAERAAAARRMEEARRHEARRREERDEDAAKARRQLADATRPILERAAVDPEVARILDRRLRLWRRYPIEAAALDPDWSRTTDDGSRTFARVRREIRAWTSDVAPRRLPPSPVRSQGATAPPRAPPLSKIPNPSHVLRTPGRGPAGRGSDPLFPGLQTAPPGQVIHKGVRGIHLDESR